MYGGEVCDIRDNEVSSLRINESEDIKSVSGGVGKGLGGRGNQGWGVDHESRGGQGGDEVIDVFQVKGGGWIRRVRRARTGKSGSRTGKITRASSRTNDRGRRGKGRGFTFKEGRCGALAE